MGNLGDWATKKWEMGDLDPKWEQELGDWEGMRWEHGRLAERKVGGWEIQTPLFRPDRFYPAKTDPH